MGNSHINVNEVRTMDDNILWILIALFTVLWLGGVMTSHLFGGMLHILLIVAVLVLIFKLVRRV